MPVKLRAIELAYTILASRVISTTPSVMLSRMTSKWRFTERSSRVTSRGRTASLPRMPPCVVPGKSEPNFSMRARTWLPITSNGALAMQASAPKPGKSTCSSAAIAERTTKWVFRSSGIFRVTRQSLSPLMLGMMRSTKMTSGVQVFSISSAERPSFAVRTSDPWLDSKPLMNFSIRGWLSTTRTFPAIARSFQCALSAADVSRSIFRSELTAISAPSRRPCLAWI